MENTPVIRTVRIDGFEMDYFTFGTGDRPFVLLPGLSLHSVMGSAAAVMQGYAAFGESYTVYVLDPRKNVPRGYTISQLADDTARVLDQLNIHEADVLGCSMGGIMAQYLAARRPDLVRKAVFASTIAIPNASSRAVMNAWAALAAAGERVSLNRLVCQKVYSPAFVKKYQQAFDAMEDQGTVDELRQFSILARAIETERTFEELDRVQCKALVIGSWDDAIFTGEASVEIAKKLNCPLYLYTGVGHAAYDEAPDYRQRLLDFFRA